MLRLFVVSFDTSSALFYYWLLPLQIYRCVQLNAVLFVVVVHASCDEQDSLMRGGLCRKLHG